MVQFQDSRRPFAAMVALAVAAVLQAGCNRSSNEAIPEFPVEPAEAAFEQVTQRLESALEDAQAVAGSGVESNRECSYRLIPPADGNAPYKAEVTIETTTRLLTPKLPARPQPKPKVDTPEAIAAAAEDAEAPPEPTPREVAEQDAAKMVETSETRSQETFRLTYKDDRWQLDKLPEEPLEQIVFEYALGY